MSATIDFINSIEKAQDSIGRQLGSPDRVERQIEDYGASANRIKNTGLQLTRTVQQTGQKVIDIGKRLQAAFGGISSNASTNLKRAGFADAVANAQVFIADTRTSFEDVTFSGNGTELKFGIDGFITGNSTLFAPPPMISFSKEKRIEVTVVDGTHNGVLPGEVVELYGHRPWDMVIKGILIDAESHNHPGDKVRQLIQFFDIDAPWDVTSELCYNHNVKSLYFTKITSEGVQGYEDTWSYTLYAKSFQPVPFYLKQKSQA